MKLSLIFRSLCFFIIAAGFVLLYFYFDKRMAGRRLETAFNEWKAENGWHGASPYIFTHADRPGVEELKASIAADPGLALSFFEDMDRRFKFDFAVAAVEAMGGDAVKVGYPALKDKNAPEVLMREFRRLMDR